MLSCAWHIACFSQLVLFSNSAIWGCHRQLDDSLVGQLTRGKQMWNIKLSSEEVEICLSFFMALSLDRCLQEQDVCEMVEMRAWEWWQGDLWPQVATKNYWTEGEPLAPRSYQLMIALVLSSPKTQNSFQTSRPEIDTNNNQHPCIKYQKNHPLRIR